MKRALDIIPKDGEVRESFFEDEYCRECGNEMDNLLIKDYPQGSIGAPHAGIFDLGYKKCNACGHDESAVVRMTQYW